MEHVFCVFCFGSQGWSWSRAALDRIKRWETKAVRRVFRFEKEDETWANYCARIARKIWTKMKLPFLSEVIAESMRRAMGCVCDERPNAVINTLKQVFRWRSTKRRQSTKAVEMEKTTLTTTQGGNTCGSGIIVGASGTGGSCVGRR